MRAESAATLWRRKLLEDGLALPLKRLDERHEALGISIGQEHGVHPVDLCYGALALLDPSVAVLTLVQADDFALPLHHVRDVNKLVGHEPLALILLFDGVEFRRT